MQLLIKSMLKIVQQTSTQFEVDKLQDGQHHLQQDILAEETPVALVYNGVSHAVMLATPSDLEDFALGFSLAENIIQNPKQLYGIEFETQAQGIALQMQIATSCFAELKDRRRSMAGRTGCGLCGAESLTQALRLLEKPVSRAQAITEDAIHNALHALPQLQTLQQVTGATHACAWANLQGEIQILREDVGRHNALDKLMGARARQIQQGHDGVGFFVTTSRASYEMVQKTACADIALLIAVSAPTALAVRLAQQLQITLVGFARAHQMVIYTDAQGLIK